MNSNSNILMKVNKLHFQQQCLSAKLQIKQNHDFESGGFIITSYTQFIILIFYCVNNFETHSLMRLTQ